MSTHDILLVVCKCKCKCRTELCRVPTNIPPLYNVCTGYYTYYGTIFELLIQRSKQHNVIQHTPFPVLHNNIHLFCEKENTLVTLLPSSNFAFQLFYGSTRLVHFNSSFVRTMCSRAHMIIMFTIMIVEYFTLDKFHTSKQHDLKSHLPSSFAFATNYLFCVAFAVHRTLFRFNSH